MTAIEALYTLLGTLPILVLAWAGHPMLAAVLLTGWVIMGVAMSHRAS